MPKESAASDFVLGNACLLSYSARPRTPEARHTTPLWLSEGRMEVGIEIRYNFRTGNVLYGRPARGPSLQNPDQGSAPTPLQRQLELSYV